MGTITFDELLLKTAFCCMASDGHIDQREIELIELMCKESPLFKEFDFHEQINQLVGKINTEGKAFISSYFSLLDQSDLLEEQQLMLIDFAIKTIYADDIVEYSEIKFFKNIRHRLKISDEKILAKFPDIEQFLEEDIVTDTFLNKITSQYLDNIDLPQFDFIQLNNAEK